MTASAASAIRPEALASTGPAQADAALMDATQPDAAAQVVAVHADAPLPIWSAAVLARTEHALDALLPPADEPPQRLHEAMRYAALGGGKRIRPLLAHAAGEAVRGAGAFIDAKGDDARGADAEGAHAAVDAAPIDLAACAVELMHAYSLVHDDLPCMDDDTLRRGRPTVWVVYGEACAMLVGDALQTLAFEALARIGTSSEARLAPGACAAMVAELARAAGSRGMAGGQAIDLESVGRALPIEALRDMHGRKTGALLRAAVLLGARSSAAAGDAALACLDRYAQAVGLAFQVIDDVLDVESDTATLGKTAGKDGGHDKPTYVSALGLAPARALAERLRDEAHAAIGPLGAPARRLHELADLIVSRRS